MQAVPVLGRVDSRARKTDHPVHAIFVQIAAGRCRGQAPGGRRIPARPAARGADGAQQRGVHRDAVHGPRPRGAARFGGHPGRDARRHPDLLPDEPLHGHGGVRRHVRRAVPRRGRPARDDPLVRRGRLAHRAVPAVLRPPPSALLLDAFAGRPRRSPFRAGGPVRLLDAARRAAGFASLGAFRLSRRTQPRRRERDRHGGRLRRERGARFLARLRRSRRAGTRPRRRGDRHVRVGRAPGR